MVHPEDEANIDKFAGFEEDGSPPVPYVGNLTRAKLVMVMLNPGHKGDEERNVPRNKAEDEARERCLVQDPLEGFWPLTVKKRPDSLVMGGREYWRSIFKSYAVARRDIEDTYSKIANSVCCVQMVPYASEKGPGVTGAMELKSVKMMQAWIDEELRLAYRPVIVFRGWPYLENLRVRPNDEHFIGFKPNMNFLRRPSFNPRGKYSHEAAKVLDRVLSE
jgi:hypothetical protein